MGFFSSFLNNVRSIPNKFGMYLLSLQVKARLQTLAVKGTSLESMLTFQKVFFYALKEHLVGKEKFALPPYCKEVSKKQTLKDSLSFFVASSIVETAGPLNV